MTSEVNPLKHYGDDRLSPYTYKARKFLARDVVRTEESRAYEQQAEVALGESAMDLLLPQLANQDGRVAPQRVVVLL